MLATRDPQDAELAEGHFLAHKVNIQLNVFCSPVMDRVVRHVDAGDVVAVCHSGLGDAAVELAKQLTKPGALSDDIGDAAVLRLRA